ncbi:unnamed protein product, partial [Laminaria digitata]
IKNAIHDTPLSQPVGKRLPVSFHGSHVNRKRKQLDAMAVVTRMGKPHFMVTFTANPKWPEIVANLYPGQTGMDRPDLVNRVFNVQLRALLSDLKSKLFDIMQYMMYVIEYQGRGVVHAHIIIKYHGQSPEERGEVDDIIWTNLPDVSIADGLLRKQVLKYIVHKPCGIFNPSAPCMKTHPKTKMKYCQKAYPQPFKDALNVSSTTGRAEYKRLNNGDSATIKCKNGENKTIETQIDNRSNVPFNAWLIAKFGSHICFDLVTAKAVIAYLYKYAYKGDTIRARILYGKDEIEAYRSCRYISSSEAMWHIFGFTPQERTPSVQLLFIHLKGEQPVVFDEADSVEGRQHAANIAVSNLMRYF